MKPKNQRPLLLAGLVSCIWAGYLPQTFAADNAAMVVQQQTKKISGTVTDAQGPIIGATVRVVGTKIATVTDFDGRYTLNVPAGATLSVNYVGYIEKKIKVGSQSTIDVTIVEDSQNLNEVVVVGYGTMKKSDLAGASTSLDEKTLKSAPMTNVDDALQGRVSGVTTMTTSGAPGSAVSVSVRGQATINANSDPLYVVDGVIWQGGSNSGASLGLGDALGNGTHSAVSPLSLLNPADIVSMEVLKDASATAIYGAQGANGVILITTKQGKSGEAKFTYNGSVSASRQNKRLDIMNLREYAEFYNSLVAQGEISKPDAIYSDPSILGIGTNWQDAIFRTAWSNSHQISAEGGTDKIKYYLSGNYEKQNGTIIGSDFSRYGFRVNVEAQLKNWLKVGTNNTYSKTSESLKLADSDEGLINYSLTTPPDIQIYDVDGNYSSVSKEGYTNPNPIAMALMDDILLDRQSLNGSVFADITPIKHFTWHAQFGYNVGASKGSTYNPKVNLGTWNRDQNQSRIQKNSNTYWSLSNYLSYNNNWGKHSVSAMLGQEAWESKYDYTSVYNTNLPNDIVHNPALGTGDPQIGAGWGSSSMASFFTRETYNFDDRYLATYTFRYDGSSNFGPNKRWAGFHSVALAWRFSNEKFIRDIAGKWLSNGKLRMGWGQTGNSNIGSYKWGSAMSVMETSLGVSYRPANLKNLDIKWETQEQLNIGLDLGFFDNRLNFTFDAYKKESKDMLMQLILPSIMGTSGNSSSALAAPYGNYGDIENTGFEFDISGKPIATKDFDWTSDFNISFNSNKLKSLSGSTALLGYGQWTDVVTRTVPGESLFSFYGYQVEGVYTSFEDILNSPVNTLQQNNPIVTNADGTKSWSTDASKYSRTNTTYVGDLKFKDVNNDGIIDENDKTNIGSPWPKFTFGFNNSFRYKNFDLNIFLNGSVGGKIGNYMKMKLTHMNSVWTNQLVDVAGRAQLTAADGNTTGAWYDNIANVVVSNPDATLPRASINDPNDNDAWSSRYIESGSYLRLKSITLGYTLPRPLVSKLGMNSVRISLNATNLFTITGYDGYDPEIGASTASANVFNLDNGRYPSPTTVTFNLNLSF
ncbi:MULTISPECIES: SusC/RagA family TonB-linked outer membrane protein [Segatella]|uniref:SusC/RagA family TonB-linked outer membrane protein n=1 Tax=Segatella bryantii TaxID=77095 RepID=A0AA37ML90_SEGBR|nr:MULTISPECIES: TonB-dependent receptor [Segatella]UKK78128.1 TonB-dependent receptor [Segatella baroniae B14]GJG27579.1 SusC/RagA family TonB-linked outer membrane protein [Segatella bryantii]SER09975.1 TonB-linked outer membrane protein, SusC/RagA family [Segatella baroniae B14]